MRAGLPVLVVAAVVAGIVVAGAGRGYPAQQVRLLSGAAWLTSAQVGQVTLLDGSAAEVAAQLQVAPPGDSLDVVQQGSTAYAVDRTAGTIRRIDGATFELSQAASPIADARGGLTAFADPETLYALDTQRGILVDTDPRTLAGRGQPLSLAAELATGSATLDAAGRLWVIDNNTGDLVSVTGGQRNTYRSIAKPGRSELTMAAEFPVVVDHTDRKAIVVNPESGEVRNTLTLDLNPADTVAVSGSPHAQRMYLVASRGVLSICDLDATACDNVVPLDATGSELGPAVEAGNRLFVPDYTTGQVWIIDLTGKDVVAKSAVLTPPARFQLLTRDGVVFFNDPATERAGVIRLDGGVRPIAKYDPKDPNKGLNTPPTNTTALPNPNPNNPTQPPTTGTPPTGTPTTRSQPPTTGQPPTGTRPPSPPPTTTQPPIGPPSQPPATLQITLSNTNPQVNEDITLQVSNTSGPAPTNATWDFGDGATGSGVTTSHRWADVRTYQVTVQAAIPGSGQATTSVSVTVDPMPTPQPLPAPAHVSPQNGAQLPASNDTFVWNPVTGAASYNVEYECTDCDPSQPGAWIPQLNETTTATRHDFGCYPQSPGRWRVTAIAPGGLRGAASAWWQFTCGWKIQPRVPVLVSPADGTSFSNVPRTTTLTWEPQGLTEFFTVQIECMGCTQPGQWTLWLETGAPGDANSVTFDYVDASQARWRVRATSPTITSSAWSEWWHFTYTA